MTLLTFDDAGFGDGGKKIAWADVMAVGIRTTADGPFAEDVFWQFLLPNGLIEAPGSLVSEIEPFSAHLPGFDCEKVIAAMGSCQERVFRVWHHEESRNRLDESGLRARFCRLVERLGAARSGDETFTRLHAAWSGAQRSYHNLEHLGDCLRELDGSAASASRDPSELALWYHDAIYEPGARDCERRSAALLVSDAAALGIAESIARRAAALVEATAHGVATITNDDAALVVDIDLAILGRDPLRFLEFDYSVEEEFSAIPTAEFRRGRGRFLASLLERPIYRVASFAERFEASARANIGALLRSPRYAAYA